MAETMQLHGGLIFTGKPGQALNRFCHIAAAGLSDAGHSIVRVSVLTHRQARVSSEGCMIKLRLKPAQPSNGAARRAMRQTIANQSQPNAVASGLFRLEVTVTSSVPNTALTETEMRMVLAMLYNMARATKASFVEWLSPDARLSMDEFETSFADAVPECLTPALMPDYAPYVLTDGQRPVKRDPQPDQTLSRELRSSLADAEIAPAGGADLRGLAARAMSGVRRVVAAPVTAAARTVQANRSADATT